MKKLLILFLSICLVSLAGAADYDDDKKGDELDTAGAIDGDDLVLISDPTDTDKIVRKTIDALVAAGLLGGGTIGSGGDVADTGAIRFKNADAICFEDGIEDCLTHVNDFGLVVNRDFSGGVPTVTDVDGFTMTAAQGRGYVIYATGAGTIVMNPVLPGDQFTVECHAAAAVVLNPDASGTEDTIRLDGAALSTGDSITSDSAAGDVAVCTYYAADTWSCITNGWADTN
jgi:hypothetical protein